MKAPQLKREIGFSFYVFHLSKGKAFCIVFKIDKLPCKQAKQIPQDDRQLRRSLRILRVLIPEKLKKTHTSYSAKWAHIT